MFDPIRALKAVAAVGVAVLVLGAAGVATHAEDRVERDLGALWAQARQGDVDATVRLGRFHESRYWLAEREPQVRGNPADLVLAYVFFNIAERASERLDALYGRNETEYRLRRVLGTEGTAMALAALPDWMWAQRQSADGEGVVVPFPQDDASAAARMGEADE